MSKVDPTNGTKVDFNASNFPLAVAFDGTSIWMTSSSIGGSVSKVNIATGTRVDYPTGANPAGVAYDGTSIWVTNAVSGTVSKLNPG